MSPIARALALSFAFSAGAAGAACPPELAHQYTAKAELARADAVATVWVESAQSVPGSDLPDYSGGIFHVVRVDETIKGELPSRFVIFSARDSGRFDMEVDRQYLVFVSRQDMVWRVDACGNSGEARLREPVLAEIRPRRATP
jgi:hypothetical protein